MRSSCNSTDGSSSQTNSQQNIQEINHSKSNPSSNFVKWSTREKLILISNALLYGDSNWSFVCDQINKSLLSSDLINKKTTSLCSKQYRQIVKNFTKNGLCDLKEIYNNLAKERLEELKNTILKTKQEFNDLCIEIEQICNLDTPLNNNFETLIKKWIYLKNGNQTPSIDNQEEDKYNDKLISSLSNLIESSNSSQIEPMNQMFNKNIYDYLVNESNKMKKIDEEIRQKELEKERERIEQEKQRLLEMEQEKERERQRLEQEEREKEKARLEALEKERLEKEQEEEREKQRKLAENARKEESKSDANQAVVKTESTNVEMKEEFDDNQVSTNEIKENLPDETEEHKKRVEIEKKAENLKSELNTSNNIQNESQQLNNSIQIDQDENSKDSSKTFSSEDDVPLLEILKKRESKNQSISDSPSATKTEPKCSKAKSTTSKSTRKSLRGASASESSCTSSKSTVSSGSSASSISDTEENQNESVKKTSSSSSSTTSSSSGSFSSTSNTKLPNTKTSTKQSKQEALNEDDELIFAPLIKHDEVKSTTPSQKQSINAKTDSNQRALSLRSNSNSSLNTSATSTKESPLTSQLNPKTTTSSQHSKRKSAVTTKHQTATSILNKQTSNSDSPNQEENIANPTGSESNIKQSQDDSTNFSSGNLISIKQEPITQITESSDQSTQANDNLNLSSTSSSTTASLSNQNTKTAQVAQAQQSMSNNKIFEDEKSYRAWKKSIMMILNNISCHKHATIFMQPVKDDIAPGYSSLIYRPMDLSTIKKNIENGFIKSTKEFQRDIMLMFTNALMYNSSNHNIHKISLEMFKEVLNDIEQLLNAQEALGHENETSSLSTLNSISLNKPLRYKDIRSSSTTSDKASSILSTNNNNENENKESLPNANEANTDDSVVNLLMKTKSKENSSSATVASASTKDETLNDNSSIKSCSSISTPRTSNSNKKSTTKTNSTTKQQQQQQQEPQTPKTTVNTKKRRPSVSNSSSNTNTASNVTTTPNSQKDQVEQPKSKRRKSGR